MAKANSFKTEPWGAHDKGQIAIFEDDYVHEKLFTLKATRKSSTSTISLKETLTQKDSKITTADQVKFWFPFQGTRTLYGRVKNDGFKLHYDHGELTQNDLKFNLYGSVQGKRTLAGLIWKVGAETQSKDLFVNFRFRYTQDKQLNLYNKIRYSQGSWNLGLLNSYDISQQTWNNSTLQYSWKNANNNYYLRSNGGKKYERVNIQNFLQNITFNVIHKLTDSTKLGLELQANLLEQNINNAALAWDHKCSQTSNTGLKVKADLKRNVSFSVKNSLYNYGSYIFGVHIQEFGGLNRFSYGVQVDLSL